MEQTYEWIRLAQAGDAAAKDNLLQENSGLIWSVVGRFRGRGEPEDLWGRLKDFSEMTGR